MVLESLVSPSGAEKHPQQMLLFGAIVSIIAVIVSFWVFNKYTSIVLVFLTTFAAAPLIYNIIRLEEKKDTENYSERGLLKEHSKAINAILYFFIGVTLMLSTIYIFLPAEKVSIVFEAQQDTITQINGKVTDSTQVFKSIFLNNIRVLVFCILFSFLYGMGALFILNWNASVIAVAIGGFVKEQIAFRSVELGTVSLTGYLNSVTLGLLRYSIHGIPEIAAYVIAGLAGGIISVAIIRYDFTTKNFEKIIFDTSNLLILSFTVLFIAALLEVYITPAFFV